MPARSLKEALVKQVTTHKGYQIKQARVGFNILRDGFVVSSWYSDVNEAKVAIDAGMANNQHRGSLYVPPTA